MKIAINGEILEVSGGCGLPEGTVAVKPLTQAEYNALTDEEKQGDVAYAITDDPPVSGSSWDVYSTEERRIGTWIDGKPLYRRVCTGIFPSKSEWVSFSVAPESAVIIDYNMYAMPSEFLSPTILPNVSSSVSPTATVQGSSVSNNEITVFVGSTDFYGAKWYAIVRYTKTTDTGGAA